MDLRKLITILVPAVLLAMALLFGSILLLRLFVVASLVVALSYVWVVLNVRGLNLHTAQPPEHLQVGDSFHRAVSIVNSSRLPRLWLKLQDNTDLPQNEGAAVVNITGLGSYSWDASFQCRRRGFYHLGPVTVIATDPFGIFSKQRTLGEPQQIIVYPETVDLPNFKFSSFNDSGNRPLYQSISHITPNASSVREFAVGDSLHHIHWPSTVRIGKIMVKTFDADRSHGAHKTGWILLDMNEASHFGRDQDSSIEYSISLAASVSKKYVHGGMRIGMLASNANQYQVAAKGGEEHLWQVLEVLALMETNPESKLEETVYGHMDKFRDNPLVTVIATSKTPNLIEIVRKLRNVVDSVIVILLDINTWEGGSPPSNLSRILALSGAHVYTIRKGDEITRALDSKLTNLLPFSVLE